MPQQTLNQGNPPIVWSTIDEAFQKINANFTELYLSIGGSGVNLSSIAADLIPDSDLTRDLGSVNKRWRDLYLGGNSLYLGEALITADESGAVNLPTGSRVGGTLIQDPTNVSFGQISVSGQSDVLANSETGILNFNSSGITITTNPTTDTITFTNTGVTGLINGSGISLSSSTGSVTVTNTGVTSSVAGTGISVSAPNGAVTFTNTGVTSLITDPGSGISLDSSSGIVNITNSAPNIIQPVHRFIAVSGQVTLDALGPNSTLTFARGNGIEISTDSGTNSVIIELADKIDIKGSVFADDSSIIVDSIDQRITASGGIIGNLVGNTTGYHIGDVKGSIFGDDSTKIIDAVENIVTADLHGSLFDLSSNILVNATTREISGYLNSNDGVNSVIMDAISGLQIVSTSLVDIQGAAGAQVGIGAGTSGDIYLGNGLNQIIVNGVLMAPTIDTTDSSAIQIIPDVNLNSNLTVGGDLLPNSNLGGDLGSTDKQWNSLYVSGSTIFIGGTPVSVQGGQLSVNGTPVSVGSAAISALDEGITLTSSISSLNFVGAGVSATNVGSSVTVTVAGGGGGLASRSTAAGSTGSIADTATANVTITGFKGYVLYKIQTSAAAWVRVYTSVAARTADSGRAEGVDPSPGAGVIAEVITTGAETILITPGTVGFNNESPVDTNIQLAVTNKSGAPADITVTLTVVKIED